MDNLKPVQRASDAKLSRRYADPDVTAKRGAKKAFREFLNEQAKASPLHRHNRYRQTSRRYGDYLYYQDREKFDVEFDLAMRGLSLGFDHTKWVQHVK